MNATLVRSDFRSGVYCSTMSSVSPPQASVTPGVGPMAPTSCSSFSCTTEASTPRATSTCTVTVGVPFRRILVPSVHDGCTRPSSSSGTAAGTSGEDTYWLRNCSMLTGARGSSPSRTGTR